MHRRFTRSIGFAKTLAIGGIVFLLPLIILGALAGQAAHVVVTIAGVIDKWLPITTVGGYTLTFAVAIAALVLICFAAGIMARRSIGQRLSAAMEKKLTLLFPRYAIFKDQLAGTFASEMIHDRLKPVIAHVNDTTRLGLEVERNDAGLVTVYFPGAPDPWTGTIVILDAKRITPVAADFSAVLPVFEKLGRGSLGFVDRASPPKPDARE